MRRGGRGHRRVVMRESAWFEEYWLIGAFGTRRRMALKWFVVLKLILIYERCRCLADDNDK